MGVPAATPAMAATDIGGTSGTRRPLSPAACPGAAAPPGGWPTAGPPMSTTPETPIRRTLKTPGPRMVVTPSW